MSCSAFGNPTPKLFWFKESANSSETPHYQTEENTNGFVMKSTMLIKNFSKDDAGNYTCLTVNNFSGLEKSITDIKFQGNNANLYLHHRN